ncbi:hypothetical protein Fot_26871 [Forsythia ovata]|uniref:Uncharacterized protein n=1 Tax=Forsythia ovata TaxID=205694 RepID=A0ABD1UEL2_9LAMI
MAGLLAWAADVVGGGGGGRSDEENDPDSIPLIFTSEQQTYVQELDRKATSLNRSIQDLRLRLPPPDISQRLPHLHAHSLASNAALALQLNSHSTTKQQAQLRELRLQEENTEYENAISNCENKIQEKLQEADVLQSKLKEMDFIEENLIAELERAQAAVAASQPGESNELFTVMEAQDDAEVPRLSLLEKLEIKKKELALMEDIIQDLEKKWAQVQANASKQPTPAQREKALDKQLHSLIEQLSAKQAQAEGLVSEIHVKEIEFERLNELWKRIETSNADLYTARNRFGRSSSDRGHISSDYIFDPYHKLPFHIAGRSDSLQRSMLLRSAFVLYILALHVLVFIKISF